MKICCIFRGNLENNLRNASSFKACIESVKKLLGGHDVTFFMHLWKSDRDNEIEIYKPYFKENNILLEDNSIYSSIINSIASKYDIRTSYAQVSSMLSLQKAIELVDKSGEDFDVFFITRPDLLFSEKLENIEIDDSLIYFNKHLDLISSGDYCFIGTINNLILFKNLFGYLKEDSSNTLPVKMHFWIYDYIKRICNKEVKLCNIKVGENCEIYKHLGLYPHIKSKIDIFINENNIT